MFNFLKRLFCSHGDWVRTGEKKYSIEDDYGDFICEDVRVTSVCRKCGCTVKWWESGIDWDWV